MTGEEQARRLVEAWRQAAGIRAHGTQSRSLRSCGLSDDYLYNVALERIPLCVYLDLVKVAGLDPVAHIGRVLNAADPVARLVADGKRIRRKYQMPGLLDTARRSAAVHKPARFGGYDLAEIDRLRYEDVAAATKLANEAVRAAQGPEAVARSLGVWASCQRMCYRLDLATGGLSLAVEIADASCDRAAVLRELRRASSLLKDRGEFDFALEISRSVASAHFNSGDLARFGQLSVDCAIVLVYSDLDSAAQLAQIGLRFLRREHSRDRAAAWHVISRSRAAQSDFSSASEAANRAFDAAQEVGGKQIVGRVHWLRGIVESQRGNYENAIGSYERALEHLAESPFDAILIGAELVLALVKTGRSADACRTAQSLAWFEPGLRDDPLDVDRRLVAACLDLVECGKQAQISLAAVELLIRKIEGGRRRRVARLRRSFRA